MTFCELCLPCRPTNRRWNWGRNRDQNNHHQNRANTGSAKVGAKAEGTKGRGKKEGKKGRWGAFCTPRSVMSPPSPGRPSADTHAKKETIHLQGNIPKTKKERYYGVKCLPFAFRDARAIETNRWQLGKVCLECPSSPSVPLPPPGAIEGRCRGEMYSGGGVEEGEMVGILKISRKNDQKRTEEGKNDLVWPMSDANRGV